jgi:predicted negative regulator of RcsB-dependent stress response
LNRQMMKFGAILGLVAMVSFSIWPLWQWLSIRAASAALQARTQALVEKHPELKPAWNIAMQDGVLTWAEAKEIVEGAGEKVEPEQ